MKLILVNEPKNGLQSKCSDEGKGLLAKVKAVIVRDKLESERKAKAPNFQNERHSDTERELK